MGNDDWLGSPEDARPLFASIPATDKELAFYDAGHSLPPGFATDAAAWLIARLVGKVPDAAGR